MRIFDLAIKDLLQILRDWKAAFFLIAMPIGFTLLFGFIFSEQPLDTDQDSRLRVIVVDFDQDLLGEALFTLLADSESVRPEAPETVQSLAELTSQVEDGDIAAVMTIPEGYSNAVLASEPAHIEVIINTESGAGNTAKWAIQSAVSRLFNAVSAAEFSTRTMADFLPFSNSSDRQTYFEISLNEALTALQTSPLILESSFTGQDVNEDNDQANSFTQSSPGMMVQFAIAGLIGAAEILVLERKSGSLRRLLTTSIRRYEVLLGHFLAMVVMILTQFVILIFFAQIFLEVPYFNAPIASFLMALATAIFAASTGLLISTLAKTPEQVVVFSLIPMFILSGLGGAWMPLEFTSESFQKVAYLTPLAWSMTGFKNIIERGLGLQSVMIPVGIILAFSIVLFGLAAWRFKFEE